MRIVTSWEEQGLQRGLHQEALTVITRLLRRRVGAVPPAMEVRLGELSVPDLEDLGEALLDFTQLSEIEAWLQQRTPAGV